MTRFHSDDYVNFLRVITPDNMQEYMRQLQRCVRGIDRSIDQARLVSPGLCCFGP